MAKCDECAAKAARTAAGPPMDGPPAEGGGDDMAARMDAMEERMAAMEEKMMQSQIASLDAMPVTISQFV